MSNYSMNASGILVEIHPLDVFFLGLETSKVWKCEQNRGPDKLLHYWKTAKVKDPVWAPSLSAPSSPMCDYVKNADGGMVGGDAV